MATNIITTDIHRDIEEWMALAISRALDLPEQEAFDAHLAGCAPCAAVYRQELTMTRIVEEAFAACRPAPGFEDKMVARFRASTARRQQGLLPALHSWWRLRPVQLTGACALLLALAQVGRMLTNEAPSVVMRGGKEELLAASQAPDWRFKAEPGATSAGVAGAGKPVESHHFDDTLAASTTIPWDESVSEPTRSAYGSLYADVDSKTPANATAPASRHRDGEDLEVQAAAESSQGEAKAAVESRRAAIVQNLDELSRTSSKIRGRESSTTASPGKLPAVSLTDNWFKYHTAGKETLNFARKSGDVALTIEPGEPAANAAPQAPEVALPAAPDSRKLIRNANVSLEVASYETALDAITAVSAGAGGYVATNSSSRQANGKLQGTVVCKVLPAQLEAFLLKLRGLGEVKSQALATEDITKAYFDTEARIRNARKMEERLLEMLEKEKGKVTELLQVEKEIGRIREGIESMQGQMKVYDAQVQLATVTIALAEKDLNQAAAFLLKEKANLALFSPDVEKTYREARREAEAAKAQIIQARLTRDTNGKVSAVLSLLVSPEASDGLLNTIKAMGRIQTLTWENERVAQGGSGPSETAKVERDKVELNLSIGHDDESRRQVNLSVVTREVEATLDKAKAGALAQGAEVVTSNLERTPQGRASARLTVRVPAANYDGVLNLYKSLGRVSDFSIQRDDRVISQTNGEARAEAPVLLSLVLRDEEEALQNVTLSVLATSIEAKVAEIKQAAAEADVEIKSSSFDRTNEGQEIANLTFRTSVQASSAFVGRIRQLGKVKDYTVRRQDRASAAGGNADATAPAEIALHLYSEGDLVSGNTGLLATLRRTITQGAEALMWSVRMIGVAIAFLAPWVIALGLAGWILYRVSRRRAG